MTLHLGAALHRACALLFTCLLCVCTTPAAALTLHVASGESIQAAIDRAAPGDTIEVVVWPISWPSAD
jgi:nitrous oxidase accessory protein